jgi:hypothetical protein
MQLQTVLRYSYTYDMIFIIQFLKSNKPYITSGSAPPPMKNSGCAPVTSHFLFSSDTLHFKYKHTEITCYQKLW